MRLAMKPARSAGPALRIRTAGHALLVHPKGPPEPSAMAFAGALTPDPEHTLVVVDLLPADLDAAWPALADLLARRPGSLRLVFHPSVEGPPVGQRIADQLKRTVLTPDGEALPTAGGGLFVPADSGTGWLRLRPGRAAERDSHRYPKPLWEFATYDRLWQTSPLGVVEPVPGGVWVRSARPAELAAGRRRLIAALPGHPNALTVVLGSPGGPAVPLADVTRFWGTVLPSARTGVRFVHFGPVALPEGSGALGQVLADALRQRVVLSPGPAASDAADAAGGVGSAPVLQGEVVYSPAPGYLAEPPAWNTDADAPAVRVVEPPVAPVEAPTAVPAPVSAAVAEGVVELGPATGGAPTPAAGTVVEPDPAPVSAPQPVAEPAPAPLPLPTSLVTSSPGPVADWPAPAFEPKAPALETEPEAAPTTPPVLTSLLESAPPEPVAPVTPVTPGTPVEPTLPPIEPSNAPAPEATPPSTPPLPSIEPSSTPAPAPEPQLPSTETPVASQLPSIEPSNAPVPAPEPQLPSTETPVASQLPSIEPSNAPVPAPEPQLPPTEPPVAPGADDVQPSTPAPVPAPLPAMPRIRLESGAPATPPPVEPAPSVDVPTPPPAVPTTPAVPPAVARATGVRVQPVPSAAALALPPERGLERERDWVRRKFSAQYHAVAGTVARVMSESPGLRSASRALDGDALTDLVAVRLYLSGDSAAVDAAVRAGSAGPHVPLARCVASGLYRLPSYRGVALLRAAVTRPELDWYEEGRAATEWAFCTARISVPETPGDGTTDFLIWSMTARRTSLLDPSDPDRVLFPPGTTFKVLRAGSATEPVLLRELLPSEGDEDTDPDAPRLPLDEIALEGLTQAAEQLPTHGSPAPGGPPPAAPPGLITTPPEPPARAAQGTRAPIEGAKQ